MMTGRFHYLCPKATLWDIDSEIGKTFHQLGICSKKVRGNQYSKNEFANKLQFQP